MCDECKSVGKAYPCALGRPANLCSQCYAAKLRTELATAGYSLAKIEKRYAKLATNPDALEQWQGVCGFAANVHELLKRKAHARDLFEATFHDLEPKSFDPEFRMADGRRVRIPFVELIGTARTAVNAVNAGYLVDWCLCRALMYLLDVKDHARYVRDVAFSDLFAIPSWFEAGHFALQTETVAFVAREILGFKVLWVLKHDYAPTITVVRPTTDRLSQQTADLTTTTDPYKRGLAMAREAEFLLDGSTAMFTSLHTGAIYGSWTNASASDASVSAALVGGALNPAIDKPAVLPFNHWIIIDKARLSPDKKMLHASIWTWHTRRSIDIKVEVLTNYLREAVFVKL